MSPGPVLICIVLRTHVLDVEAAPDSIPTPTTVPWLEGVALRDVALHEGHAACVDARGDLYQWGDGFFGSDKKQQTYQPVLTLRGKVSHYQVPEKSLFTRGKDDIRISHVFR